MVFEGIWILVLLTYAHLVYASTSIVNCRELDGEMVSLQLQSLLVLVYILFSLQRWFINGTVQCYKNEHLGLAFLAIISLIVAGLLIIFTAFIIYHDKIKYTVKFPVCHLIISILLSCRWFYIVLQHTVKTMASNLRTTLISDYRPNYIFWPVVELLRRYIFIIAVVLSPGDLVRM